MVRAVVLVPSFAPILFQTSVFSLSALNLIQVESDHTQLSKGYSKRINSLACYLSIQPNSYYPLLYRLF
jgi:hypothetical protein